MRTVHESAQLLVVSDTSAGFRLVGVVAACLGGVVILSGLRTSGTPMMLIGAATLAIGGMLALLPLITTISSIVLKDG